MRQLVIDLTKEGKSPREIQGILKYEFGEHALRRSAIYNWAAKARLGFEDVKDQPRPGRPIDDKLIDRVAEIIEDEPFASVAYIAHILNSNKSTIYRYLTEQLGRVYKHSRWVPHLLTHEQKLLRVRESKALHSILLQCQRDKWANIITGDQSWFFFGYGEDGAWVLPEEDAPVMDGSKIQIQKVMITVIWGVHGMHLIDALPEGESFNSRYFISNIVDKLEERKPLIWPQSNKRKIWLHLDNCRVHNSIASVERIKEAGFKRTPHPPYSPDIAPSDFFLFGYTKQKLKGCGFAERDDLLEKIYEILTKISTQKRKDVFEAWIKRCEYIFTHGGEYYQA